MSQGENGCDALLGFDDSRLHQLNTDEVYLLAGDVRENGLDQDIVEAAVFLLGKKLGCEALQEEPVQAECQTIASADLPVCYVELKAGYALVTEDLVDTVNLLISRWD